MAVGHDGPDKTRQATSGKAMGCACRLVTVNPLIWIYHREGNYQCLILINAGSPRVMVRARLMTSVRLPCRRAPSTARTITSGVIGSFPASLPKKSVFSFQK